MRFSLPGIFRRSRRPFTHVEYWVYTPHPKLPPQELLLGRMLKTSPFKVGGKPAIGPAEGLVFSDVRLHVSLVLREKNAHLFRPDLFEAHVEPKAEHLEGMSTSVALIILRFTADERIPDDRQLRALTHMAEATAYYARATTLFDVAGERLLSAEEFRERLSAGPEATRPDLHLTTYWANQETGGIAATRGLIKIGFPEIETYSTPSDYRSAATAVVHEAATMIWDRRTLPFEDSHGRSSVEVEAFGDTYRVLLESRRNGPFKARILRLQPT